MRLKKQKQVRRNVRFYKTCFGFREPYKVLCDGTFIHYNLTQHLGSLQDSLPALLGAAAKPFVTRCVTTELKKLGEAYSGTVLAARRLDLAKCQHEPPMAAADCLAAMVGSNNAEHFFVATQDIELRKQLRKVHGGALIYSRNTWLVLEPPSPKQQEYARLSESERIHVTEREQHLMEGQEGKRKKKNVDEHMQSPCDTVGLEDAIPDPADSLPTSSMHTVPPELHSRSLGVKDRPTFKRKRVKGPNPLSCKKKQKEVQQSGSTDKHKAVEIADRLPTQKVKVRRRVRRKRTANKDGSMDGKVLTPG